jgi:hypothetical protein
MIGDFAYVKIKPVQAQEVLDGRDPDPLVAMFRKQPVHPGSALDSRSSREALFLGQEGHLRLPLASRVLRLWRRFQ